jgi:hypothetical protein
MLRFKGADTTFREFPGRLENILSKSLQDFTVECIIFPAYEVGHQTTATYRGVLTRAYFRPRANW